MLTSLLTQTRKTTSRERKGTPLFGIVVMAGKNEMVACGDIYSAVCGLKEQRKRHQKFSNYPTWTDRQGWRETVTQNALCEKPMGPWARLRLGVDVDAKKAQVEAVRDRAHSAEYSLNERNLDVALGCAHSRLQSRSDGR